MTERGFRGGLVSKIRNQQSGKVYIVSTAQEIGMDYWSTVILNIKFFGLWLDFKHPLYTCIRNNKEDAYSVHNSIKKIVESAPEREWLDLAPAPNPPEGYSEDAKRFLGKSDL